MPALPRKQAAKKLGISESTLRRLTASGIGVVSRGRRGRHNQTLYDTIAIAEVYPIRRAQTQRDAQRAAQLHRGAMTLTLPAAIDRELALITVKSLEGLAASCSDSTQFLQAIVRYMKARIGVLVEDHFRLKIPPK